MFLVHGFIADDIDDRGTGQRGTARNDAIERTGKQASGAVELPAIAGDEPTSTATSASAGERAVSVACAIVDAFGRDSSARPSAISGASAGADGVAREELPFNRGAAANDQRPDGVRVERTRCA
jgi:hypothetical protein